MNKFIPVIAEAHTPPYRIHRYFARRPWNVFNSLIKTFTKEGQVVMDPFCGGGVTIYEGIKQGRKLIGYDINPLSIFIVENMVKNGGLSSNLDKAFTDVKVFINELYSGTNTMFEDNCSYEIEWNEVAFVAKCNLCGQPTLLSNANKIQGGRYHCDNNKCEASKEKGGYLEPKNCERTGIKYLWSVAKGNKKYKNFIFNNERILLLEEHIKKLEKIIKVRSIDIPHDEIPLNWDRQYEDLLFKKNIKSFQDLFTKRNLLINLLTLDYIKKINLDDNDKKLLRLAFSDSLRDTNIMSFTNEGWQSGRPTTWSKHAYWLPNQFCEVNVCDAFNKSTKKIIKALQYNQQFNYKVKPTDKVDELTKDKNLFLHNGIISDLKIPDEFVDCVITDPPYGSNVQYLELSHFWFPWNKDVYQHENVYFSNEAVANRKNNFKGHKTFFDYESNLFDVFKECYRVLKPGGNLIMTFNNKDIRAWMALLISIFKSGFVFESEGLYFQTGVKNYKQTAHTKYSGSPYGDYIYIFTKDKKSKLKNINSTLFGQDILVKQINNIVEKYLDMFKTSNDNKDELIRKMMLDIIPLFSMFVLSPDSSNHSLYNLYKKNYLDSFYL